LINFYSQERQQKLQNSTTGGCYQTAKRKTVTNTIQVDILMTGPMII